MKNFVKHPAVVLTAGVLIGVVFASRVRSLPVAKKLPSA